jgi:K+-sensing histidine kinase KdpD
VSEETETRLAVGIELWSAGARALIRTAATTAAELHRPWVAIVVSDSAHAASRLTTDQQERVLENTELIQSLGGSPVFCEGDDVGATLVAAAKALGADTLMIAKPRPRGALARLVSREVSDALVHHPAQLRLVFVDAV